MVLSGLGEGSGGSDGVSALAQQGHRPVEAKTAAVCSHPALPEDFKPF